MRNKYEIGKITCSYEKVHREYYPILNIRGKQKFYCIIPYNVPGIIALPIEYREYTRYHEHPSFRMRIYDSSGRLLDTVELSPADQPGYFNPYNMELRYEVPRVISEKKSVKLVFKIEAKLTVHPWLIYRGAKSDKPPIAYKKKTIKKIKRTKTINVYLKRGRACPLWIYDSECTYGNYNIPWATPYKLSWWVVNLGQEILKIETIRAYAEDLHAPDRRKKQLEVPYGASETMNVPAELVPPYDYYFPAPKIINVWRWWYDGPIFFEIIGPTSRLYRYTFEMDVRSASIGLIKFTSDCIVRAYVPGDKLRSAEIARFLSVLNFFMIFFPPTSLCDVFVSVLSSIAEEAASDLAKDPLEFDKNYKRLPDRKRFKYSKPRKELKDSVFDSFTRSFDKVAASTIALNTGLSRYMSAKLKNDRAATRRQKQGMEIMRKELEQETCKLRAEYKTISAQMSEAIDEDMYIETFKQIKEKGFNASQRRQLRKRGITGKKITAVTKSIEQSKLQPDQMSPLKAVEKICDFATDCYFSVVEEVKRVETLDKSPRNDVIRELKKEGFIGPVEANKMMNKLQLELNYPLNEIKCINGASIDRLSSVGIKRTADLLENCRKRADRIRLAKSTGISSNVILRWANIADLMRVRGIGYDYAEFLERSGVDTVVELGTRNAAELSKHLKAANREMNILKRAPSKSIVTNWIKETKKLDRILEYRR